MTNAIFDTVKHPYVGGVSCRAAGWLAKLLVQSGLLCGRGFYL